MKIELREITIGEVAADYLDRAEEGVTGYGGRLDIRPAYQREFIYGEKQRNAVVDTILRGFPLNVMYWAVTGRDSYEVMDGQQRTISFCQYVNGDFSVLSGGYPMTFGNLPQAPRDQILGYRLMVYLCSGTDQEKLDWFRTVNIAGVRLADQELRNAVYAGPWLTHAKSVFSRTNCPAYGLASRYLNGVPIRQDYLETALRWRSGGNIEQYMSEHQHDPNAGELWRWFQDVISWAAGTFPVYRREMKGADWGALHDEFSGGLYDTAALEREVSALMADDDVTRRKGIYAYVLTRDEKHLAVRAFSPAQKRAAYERQGGTCPRCGQRFELAGMDADHITPWSEGGRTDEANCQVLCRYDNRRKGAS